MNIIEDEKDLSPFPSIQTEVLERIYDKADLLMEKPEKTTSKFSFTFKRSTRTDPRLQ